MSNIDDIDVLIVSKTGLDHAFGIRAFFINGYLMQYGSNTKVVPFEWVRNGNHKKIKYKHVLLIGVPEHIRDVFDTLREYTDGKLFYVTASIMLWEQPDWALTLRDKFDFILLGCSWNGLEMKLADRLGVKCYFTPFGVYMDAFTSKFNEKTEGPSVLLEDSMNGKDEISLYVDALDIIAESRPDETLIVYGWDNVSFKSGNIFYRRCTTGKFFHFTDNYKRPWLYLNGYPRMEKIQERWYPSRDEFRNMAIYDNCVLESMAAGCFNIGFAKGMQNEIINDDVCLLVPYNIDSVITAIKMMFSTYNENLFIKCRDWAKSFDWPNIFAEHWVEPLRKEGIIK